MVTNRSSTAIELVGVEMPVNCVFNARARRYRLGLDRTGAPRLTIPQKGSLSEAMRFAQQHVGWLRRQIERRSATRQERDGLVERSEVFFRGARVCYELVNSAGRNELRLAGETIRCPNAIASDGIALRGVVFGWMRALAARELPVRTMELARLHGLDVARVSVRNQRTRWGSCSSRRVVSLNWRLVQVPEAVRDYIILHELMHLRAMNHSPRFWKMVEEACPGYREAEAWLKAHNGILSARD